MSLPSKYDHLATVEEIHAYYLSGVQLDAEAEREFFADDYVHHTPEAGQAPDFSGVLQSNEMFEGALDELEMEVLQIVAQDDLVSTYKVITGIHVGDTLGPPATGRRVRIPIMDLTRYRDRQISEHWHVMDLRDLEQSS